MKVTINEKPTQEKAEYPCLKVATDTGRVVLFTSESAGTVVYERISYWGMGHYSDKWYKQDFTPFNGSITLEND